MLSLFDFFEIFKGRFFFAGFIRGGKFFTKQIISPRLQALYIKTIVKKMKFFLLKNLFFNFYFGIFAQRVH